MQGFSKSNMLFILQHSYCCEECYKTKEARTKSFVRACTPAFTAYAGCPSYGAKKIKIDTFTQRSRSGRMLQPDGVVFVMPRYGLINRSKLRITVES